MTTAELCLSIQSVRNLLAGSSDAAPLLGAVVESERAIVDRFFLLLVDVGMESERVVQEAVCASLH